MYKLEELKRVYQEYEKDYINSDYIIEDKQMNYNYLITGCITYHGISKKGTFECIGRNRCKQSNEYIL